MRDTEGGHHAHRALGTLGTAGLLLLTLTLTGCGASGQSGTKAAATKSASGSAAAQACAPVAGDQLVVLTDDKKLQTVDNVIPAINAKAATQPLIDALNKVSATLTTEKLVALNKATDIDRKTSPNAAKEYVAAEGSETASAAVRARSSSVPPTSPRTRRWPTSTRRC